MSLSLRGIWVPPSYIDSTNWIKQVGAYENVARMGEKLAQAGAVFSAGVDVKNWGKDVNYMNNLERDFALNKQSVSQNIRKMEDQRALLLIKDRILLASEQAKFNKMLQPLSNSTGTGIGGIGTRGMGGLNPQGGNFGMNTNQQLNSQFVQAVQAAKLGLTPAQIYSTPGATYSFSRGQLGMTQNLIRNNWNNNWQPYQFKPPKPPSTSYSSSRKW